MDHVLRCNKCRAEIPSRALVTSCSHMFCENCANQSGLTSQDLNQRVCPVCEVQLLGPDDVVINNLNPSEGYKSTVLAALSPSAIMECAGKATSFWAYQMSQELVYQDFNYQTLSIQFDKVINDANAQIAALQNKVHALCLDQDSLRRKNEELVQSAKEKDKRLLQTQELYDKLKRKTVLGQMRDPASDVMMSNFEGAAASGTALADQVPHPTQHEHAPLQDSTAVPGRGGPSDYRYGAPGSRSSWGSGPRAISTANWSSQDNREHTPMTAYSNRNRIGDITGLGFPGVPGVVTATPLTPMPGQIHTPLPKRHSPRATMGGFSGVGISSGMKASDINPAGYVVRPVETSATQRNFSGNPRIGNRYIDNRHSGSRQLKSRIDDTN